MTLKTATLGGGCFWCIEPIFQQLIGISNVRSGFSGGDEKNPSYRDITSGMTGHAEVIQFEYDDEKISYTEIIEVFLTVHDPTTKNRQGNDVGYHYRSIILFHSADQKKIAEKVIVEFDTEKIWKNKIVTEIKEYTDFYIAEDYHQNYFNLNSNQPYCKFVIEPKISKFRKKFIDKLKK